MRLTKQTKCTNCGHVIKQMPALGPQALTRCEDCNRLQVLDLVPEYEWEERGNVTRAFDHSSNKCLAAISHGVGVAFYSVAGAPIQEAKSVEDAKKAVEDLINGVTTL